MAALPANFMETVDENGTASVSWGKRIKRQKVLTKNPELSLASSVSQPSFAALKLNLATQELIARNADQVEKEFGLSIFNQKNY